MTRQSADLPPAPGRRSRSEIARFMPWSMEPHNTLLHWLYGCDMGLIPNLLGIRVTHSRESYQPTTIMRLDRGVEWVNSSDFSRSVAACTSQSCSVWLRPSSLIFTRLIVNGHFRNLNWRYLPYTKPIFQALISKNIPTVHCLAASNDRYCPCFILFHLILLFHINSY